ncbi:hypothetical protein [Epilithonimonas sp.]|uniref:hypothetical protein n=1 Tax=Epilithonimonas sp. TaxID=2894511 RepID=UPI0028995006|nr:hypothetical protein [Epilithonimonas sp.]
MEATELRLNNLMMYGDSIVPIIGMESSQESVLVKIDQDTAVDYRRLKPIALTVEWFSKLGFKEAYRSKSRIRFDLPNCCRYDFDLDSSKILEGFLFFGNYIKCNHLHQLQNIYFTLTGEELKIEPNFQQVQTTLS